MAAATVGPHAQPTLFSHGTLSALRIYVRRAPGVVRGVRNRSEKRCVAALPSRGEWNSPRARRLQPKQTSPRPPLRPQLENYPESNDQEDTEYDMWMRRLRALPPTYRSVALMHLLRIEEEGAYAGLVGGSPGRGKNSNNKNYGSSSGKSIETDPEDQNSQLTTEEDIAQLRASLIPRDRRAVTELVSGVTRFRRRLAWTITSLPKKNDLSKMDPPLRQIMLMGGYEFLEQGKEPHVLNEYVELAKRVMHAGCGNVANATLRNLLRCIAAGTVPRPGPPPRGASEQQMADAMGVATSHPSWLVQRWVRQFGRRDAMALLQSNNRRPGFSLRLAPGMDPVAVCEELSALESDEPSAKPPSVAPSTFLPSEFIVVKEGMQAVLSTGMVDSGKAQVQDEAAALVVAMLGPQPGESLLDCCAAPGGKTLFSAARMHNEGRIVALDASAARLQTVATAAARQGVPSDFLSCVAADARQYCVNAAASAAEELFDRVLLDAPCSGTGVLCKRADLRWRRLAQHVEELCVLQGELLVAAAQAVRPGGLLVYSTCSLEFEENEAVVDKFLATGVGRQFEVEVPPAEAGVPAECLTPRGMMLTLPHVHGTDGAFAARLRRTE